MDNLKRRSDIVLQEATPYAEDTINRTYKSHYSRKVLATHRDIQEESRIPDELVSAVPRDLTNDKRADQILDRAEQFINNLERAQNTWQRGQVNPLPQTKKQLKKTQKIERLRGSNSSVEALQTQRLQEIRDVVIQNISMI